MSEDTIIRALKRAAKKRTRLKQESREAAAALRDYASQAHEQGVSITRIAREAGLSRQGVYDLLGDRPPS